MEIKKQDIRKKYTDLRNKLNQKDIDILSKNISSKLNLNFNIKNSNIHIFLPITDKKEINTWHFLHNFYKNSNTVITSIYNYKEDEIINVKINPSSSYEIGGFGIPEPKERIVFDCSKLDYIIIPLLCYDIKGNRIGYGKGIYDRILSTLPSKCMKIGISLFHPEKISIPNESHDISLDFCQTPDRLYCF